MLSESRHAQSPLSSHSSTRLSIMLMFLLQAFLLDAVRPANHEEGHAKPEIGKVQPYQITTRPGGALVQERATTKAQDPTEYDEEDDLLAYDNDTEQGSLPSQGLEQPSGMDEHFGDGYEENNGTRMESESELQPNGIGQVKSGELAGTETEKREEPRTSGVSETANTESANGDSDIRALHPPSKNREEDFAFKLAPATADALVTEAKKMKEETKTAVDAYVDVDKKMKGYEESIQFLSDGFKSLKKQAHGIHDSVLNEYGTGGEKETKRMCSFRNAFRIMMNQPPLPCPS